MNDREAGLVVAHAKILGLKEVTLPSRRWRGYYKVKVTLSDGTRTYITLRIVPKHRGNNKKKMRWKAAVMALTGDLKYTASHFEAIEMLSSAIQQRDNDRARSHRA